MKYPISCFAAFISLSATLLAADLSGSISYKGTPPAEIPIKFQAADVCGKLHKNKTTQHYNVSPKGAFKDVFVYVRDDFSGKTFAAPEKPLLLDQRDCEYEPYMSAIVLGQKVLVRNSDPLMHNVHPTPDRKTGNKEQNLVQLAKGKDLTFNFPNPELMLRFKCDVHGWMFAYVNIVKHPYFAVTDADGKFTIPNLPPGEYTIEAIHPKAGSQTSKIKIDGPAKLDFTFEPKPKDPATSPTPSL